MDNIFTAIEALKSGKIVIIYDGDEREGEADMVFHSSFASHEKIKKLRKDGGGLICLALGEKEAELLNLQFYTEILRKAGMNKILCEKTPYGDEPAFSISINHKKTYTGISDEDRALTIRELEKCINAENPYESFIQNFYSPGHVFLLKSRGIRKRRGHTELATALANMAGMSGAVVLCEMLAEKKALEKKDAEKYAAKNDIVFIDGKKIVEKFR